MLAAPLVRRVVRPQCIQNDSFSITRQWVRYRANMRDGLVQKGRQREDESDPLSSSGPSLLEQLFPEEAVRNQRLAATSTVQPVPEIPRLPFDTSEPLQPVKKWRYDRVTESGLAMQERASQSPQASVLVLLNASTNLVDDDFRRIIPKGEHVEDWTLAQGDIIKVIPGRNISTLEQTNFYYLLFRSKLSAFVYQGHATRLHQAMQAHTPISLTSPISPPPGTDLDHVLTNYALLPPTQDIKLRQLKLPTRLVQGIITWGGYPALMEREDRMPWEVRLVLEGPQLQIGIIRHILHLTGVQRALNWSGESGAVRVTKWEPTLSNFSPRDHSDYTTKPLTAFDAGITASRDKTDTDRDDKSTVAVMNDVFKTGLAKVLPRQPQLVYIVGFEREADAQSFIRYWHRRPMEVTGLAQSYENEESAPIANVALLW